MSPVPSDAAGPCPPLDAGAFADLMAPLGPFEQRPALAVAVSGGADSLALTVLADEWARARGGSVLALTVDHGLRAGSAAEAATVSGWLAARGVAHRILTVTARPGGPGSGGVQAAARAARYALLDAACRDHGVLHLLLAHHQDDVAETVLMRRARGSGPTGLAGMSAVSETPHLRRLRPLLAVPAARLRATLAACGQPWVEDPSNADRRYARVRARAALAAAGPGAVAALADEARARGRERRDLEAATVEALARTVRLDPAGFARIDPSLFAVPAVAERALAALSATIGGRIYPPRTEALRSLAAWLAEGVERRRGATLGGVRFAADGAAWLAVREARGLPPPVELVPGRPTAWDGRFEVTSDTALRLAPLGAAGARIAADPGCRRRIPGPALASLPAAWDGPRVAAVPHLGYVHGAASPAPTVRIVPRPPVPLGGVGFQLA